MRKGNMTILASILAIILVAVGVGAGTMAYFSDKEESTGNTFTAGTLDLTLGAMSSSPSLPLSNMAPGDSVTGSIIVTNAGTINGKLYGRTTYVEKDGDPNLVDKSADQFAAKLIVTSWTEPGIPTIYPGISVYTLVYANPTTPVTVQGLGVWQSYGPLAASATATFAMTVQFDTSAGNDYQGDGIEVKFEYLLVQTNHPTTP